MRVGMGPRGGGKHNEAGEAQNKSASQHRFCISVGCVMNVANGRW
jgi:hypothetical protein